MMQADPALERFVRCIRCDDERIRLDEGALEIARIAYPDLDSAPWLGALDGLAERTTRRVRREEPALGYVGLLNRSLFREEGFRGDRTTYFSPQNSFLNDVLERRAGIPITLAVVYIEVARRLGYPVEGIGFPGHFLLRATVNGRELILDPFDGGRALSREDCQRHLDRAFGAGVALDARFLRPVGPRQILTRILNNLKRIYISRGDHRNALAVVERLVELRPDLPDELRDRGKLRLSLEDLRSAADDLELYLERLPGAPDAPEIRLLLGQVRRSQARLN